MAASNIPLLSLLEAASGQPGSALESGRTKLMDAARAADPVRVAAALPGSNPDAQDACGLTALMHAARRGTLPAARCVKLLLAASDASLTDDRGLTAAMHSAMAGASVALRLLLPASNLEQANPKSGSNLLHFAISNEKCAEMVLREAPELANRLTLGGLSPLDLAWEAGFSNVSFLLFKASSEQTAERFFATADQEANPLLFAALESVALRRQALAAARLADAEVGKNGAQIAGDAKALAPKQKRAPKSL